MPARLSIVYESLPSINWPTTWPLFASTTPTPYGLPRIFSSDSSITIKYVSTLHAIVIPLFSYDYSKLFLSMTNPSIVSTAFFIYPIIFSFGFSIATINIKYLLWQQYLLYSLFAVHFDWQFIIVVLL